MHQFYKFILFCSSTLHVSDGLSAHHQESKIVHTASDTCQTDSADCLLAGTKMFHLVPASKQSAQSVWHIPIAVCTFLDSWWWKERLSETCRVLLQNKINLRNWCISLVLLQKNYQIYIYIYMNTHLIYYCREYNSTYLLFIYLHTAAPNWNSDRKYV